jgi:dihydrolipoamide dehydrogenase
MATVYAAIGSRVTVVELLDGLLMGADRDLVRPLEKRLKQTMAAIYTKTKVVSMANKGESIEVTFEGDLTEKVQRFSRVLVSIGRKPNSQGIGLENTKVQLDKRGFILVDKQQRTTDPQILAIGDVAGDPMLAHKAAHEGKVAVEALHGENVKFDPRAIPAVVFTDPEIAWAGITETEAKAEGVKYEAALFPWAASGRAQAVGKTEGLTKILVDPDTERILGVGMCGAHVGDMIGEGVLAIEMGATIRDFTASIHPHPTFSETLSASAEVFLGQATDLYKPKKAKKAAAAEGDEG